MELRENIVGLLTILLSVHTRRTLHLTLNPKGWNKLQEFVLLVHLAMSGITLQQYAAMNANQRGKVNKPELLSLLNSQIGQPTMVPEDTLRNIIKDTIERSIDERIPNDLGKIIEDMRKDYDEKIEKLQSDNKLLKKTIFEQQKFLEGVHREKTKNNVFVTGIPETFTGDDNIEITDKKEIVRKAFTLVNHEVSVDTYRIVKVFDPAEGKTRYSAKIVFNDYNSKMEIVKNCKNLATLDERHPLRKIYVRFDDPPLTRKENKRLADKRYQLTREAVESGSGDVYKLEKGKLMKNNVQIDEFNLSNQIFA